MLETMELRGENLFSYKRLVKGSNGKFYYEYTYPFHSRKVDLKVYSLVKDQDSVKAAISKSGCDVIVMNQRPRATLQRRDEEIACGRTGGSRQASGLLCAEDMRYGKDNTRGEMTVAEKCSKTEQLDVGFAESRDQEVACEKATQSKVSRSSEVLCVGSPAKSDIGFRYEDTGTKNVVTVDIERLSQTRYMVDRFVKELDDDCEWWTQHGSEPPTARASYAGLFKSDSMERCSKNIKTEMTQSMNTKCFEVSESFCDSSRKSIDIARYQERFKTDRIGEESDIFDPILKGYRLSGISDFEENKDLANVYQQRQRRNCISGTKAFDKVVLYSECTSDHVEDMFNDGYAGKSDKKLFEDSSDTLLVEDDSKEVFWKSCTSSTISSKKSKIGELPICMVKGGAFQSKRDVQVMVAV